APLRDVLLADVLPELDFAAEAAQADEDFVGLLDGHRAILVAVNDQERRRHAVEEEDRRVLEVTLALFPRRAAHQALPRLRPGGSVASGLVESSVVREEVSQPGAHDGRAEPVRLDDDRDRRVSAVALSDD